MSKPEQPAPATAHEPIGSDISQQFLRKHLRDVFLIVFCIVGNRAEAQEITQEAFIGVLQRYRSVARNPWVSIAVRESAIASAIKAVRRNAIDSAETVRGRVFARVNDSGGDDLQTNSKWGQRVVVLLHDAQSLPVEKIAYLLECPAATVVAALVLARLEAVPSGSLARKAAASHPSHGALILAQSRRKFPVRLRLHLGKCAQCQNAMKLLTAAAEANRQSAADELRAVESFIGWPALEREMTGNIAVGVAAARCIQHVHRKRRSTWSMVLLGAALLTLFGAGWMTHVPAESTRRLFHSIGGAFALHRTPEGVPIAGANDAAIFATTSGRKGLALPHPPSAAIHLIDPGQIEATFADPDTAQIVRESVSAQSVKPVAFSSPLLRVSIPAGAPVSVQDFSIAPLQQAARNALDRRPFHVTVNLRNNGTKPIAAVLLLADFRNRAFVSHASFGAEGMNAAAGETFAVGADFDLAPDSLALSAELTLDFVLFSDLTSFGPDTPEHRALAADEFASRSERDYFRHLIDSGQLAAARRELNFGLGEPPGADFELLDRTQHNSVPINAIALDGAPLQIETGSVTGAKLTLLNRSAHSVTWCSLSVVSFDSAGRLLFTEDIRGTMRVDPLQSVSFALDDRVRANASVPNGSISRRCVFLRAAQLGDGTWWVASHRTGNATVDLLSANPARLRLAALFRSGGLQAVQQELGYVSR